MYLLTLFLFFVSFILSNSISEPGAFRVNPNEKVHDKIVVCYFGIWSIYRKAKASFTLNDIDPNLCTHLIYAFAGLDPDKDTIKALDPWQDLPDNYGKNGYGRVMLLKRKNPKLKISLALGGWIQGSENYSKLVASPLRRTNFVNNTLQMIRKYRFDGLDLNWQFPGKRGGNIHDKENFVSLVKELSIAFSKHSLLLTASLGAIRDIIDVAYDIPAISQHLDYIHLMCYDYHGPWDSKTGPNAPLRSEQDNKNVEYTIQHFIKLGAPRNKLIVGIPFYGRTFIILPSENKEATKFGLLTDSNGFSGPFTEELGYMAYNEICIELMKNSTDWKIHWDSVSQTPFAVNGNKFISYDDVKSINKKVMLAQTYRLAGAMAWYIDIDDFRGDCSNKDSPTEEYPLLKAINKALSQPLPPSDEDQGNITDMIQNVLIENKSSGNKCDDYSKHINSNKYQISKLEKQVNILSRRIQEKEEENQEFRREIENLKVESTQLKPSNLDSTQKRPLTNKDLEDTEKLKSAILQMQQEEKVYREANQKQINEMNYTITRLEKYITDLEVSFKRQLSIVDNLKKQKIKLELIKLLKITEEEFIRILDWNFDDKKHDELLSLYVT